MPFSMNFLYKIVIRFYDIQKHMEKVLLLKMYVWPRMELY